MKNGGGITTVEEKVDGEVKKIIAWEVLTESKKAEDGKFWVHSCGEDIMTSTVPYSNRHPSFPLAGNGSVHNEPVPYCPKCEKKPISGTFQDGGSHIITQWE